MVLQFLSLQIMRLCSSISNYIGTMSWRNWKDLKLLFNMLVINIIYLLHLLPIFLTGIVVISLYVYLLMKHIHLKVMTVIIFVSFLAMLTKKSLISCHQGANVTLLTIFIIYLWRKEKKSNMFHLICGKPTVSHQN